MSVIHGYKKLYLKELNMSVARITTINFKSKEDADESIKDYSAKAPGEVPEAEQLLQIRASETTVMAISLYADNDA